nr:phosphatase PAP2 family protein [Candidatus Sigynarchaeota archaeon]
MAEMDITPATRESSKMSQKQQGKAHQGTNKHRPVLITYLISCIGFAIGIIVCSINGGALDYEITRAIDNIPELDGLGAFMAPDFWTGEFWTSGNIGQMPALALCAVGLLFLVMSALEMSKEQKMAKNENRPTNVTKNGKYFKYCILTLIIGVGVCIILTQVVKELWGRLRPDAVADFSGFTAWYIPAGTSDDSFFSGHTSFATFTGCLAVSFIGSRKKILVPILGILATVYVVLMGIARMAHTAHWFSDVLVGWFLTYSIILFTYYCILNIPGQEEIYRYKLVCNPYNEGYKLIVSAKAAIAESPDDAMAKLGAGLEKLTRSREEAQALQECGYDYSAFIERIDDLTSRIGFLMQEHDGAVKKDKKTYMNKWSYFF